MQECTSKIIEKLLGERFGLVYLLLCLSATLATANCLILTLSGVFSTLLTFNCTSSTANLHLIEAQGQIVSVSTQYELCDPSTSELTSLVFFIGMTIASVIVGPMSDLIGRVPTLLVGASVTTIGIVVGNYCSQFWLHLVMRCVSGCGTIMVQCVIHVYGNEVLTQKHRGKFNSAWTAGGSIGGITGAAAAYLTKDHQMYMIVTCAISVASLLSIVWLPESPLWLLERGSADRAFRSFKRMALVDRREPPSEEVVQQLAKEFNASRQQRQSLLVALKELDSRSKIDLLVLLVYGFCMTMYNYGFFFVIARMVQNVYVYILVGSMTGLPSAAIFNLWPRQYTLACTGILGFITSIVMVVLAFVWPDMPLAVGWATLGLGLLGLFFSTVGFICMMSATSERFPTNIRNTCVGILYIISRFGILASQAVAFVPSAPLQILILGMPVLVAGLPTLLLPDTRKFVLHAAKIAIPDEQNDRSLL